MLHTKSLMGYIVPYLLKVKVDFHLMMPCNFVGKLQIWAKLIAKSSFYALFWSFFAFKILSYSVILYFRSHDAKLPIIRNRKDQQTLFNNRKIKLRRKPIWLGGIFSQGSYLWMTNGAPTPVSAGYQNWIPGKEYQRYV